jgi:hypothetical protein
VCFIADNGNTGSMISTITKIDSDYHDSFLNHWAEKMLKVFRSGEHTRHKTEAFCASGNNKEMGVKPVDLP